MADNLTKLELLDSRKTDKINRLSPDRLQSDYNRLEQERIRTRDDGSQYRVIGGQEVPFSGKSEVVYKDTTAEGNKKLGLAYPATEDPFVNRYSKNEFFDGTPGPRGVTVADSADSQILVPYNEAAKFEYDVNVNRGTIANRAVGEGNIPKETKDTFGPGYTEYTTPQAPLYNKEDTSFLDPTAPKEGTYIQSMPVLDDKANILQEINAQALRAEQYAREHPNADSLQVSEAALSGVLGLGSRGAELLGTGLETFGEWQQRYNEKHPIKSDTVPNINKMFADFLIDQGKKLQEEQQLSRKAGIFDKTVGYDPTPVQNLGKEFADRVEQGNYGEALVGLVDPRSVTAFIQSSPEMAAMATSGGLLYVMAGNVNKNLNELENSAKEKGIDLNDSQKATSVGLSVIGTYLDRFGDKVTLGGLTDILKVYKQLPPDGKIEAAKVLATPLGTISKELGLVVPKAGVEGVTEGLQTILENKASDVDKMNLKLTRGESREALEAAGIGMGAGGIPSAGSAAANVVKPSIELTGDSLSKIRSAAVKAADTIKENKSTKSFNENVINTTEDIVSREPTSNVENIVANEIAKYTDTEVSNKSYSEPKTMASRFVDSTEERARILGSEATPDRQLDLAVEMVELASQDKPLDAVKEQELVNHIQETTGIDIDTIKSRVASAKLTGIAISALTESTLNVNEEVSRGPKGFLKYFTEAKLGRLRGDNTLTSKALDNLSRFYALHSDKLNTIRTEEKGMRAELNGYIDTLAKRYAGNREITQEDRNLAERALYKKLTGPARDKRKANKFTYSQHSFPFSIRYDSVLERMMAEKEGKEVTGGVYPVIDTITREVDAMGKLYESLGGTPIKQKAEIKVTKPEVTLKENIVEEITKEPEIAEVPEISLEEKIKVETKAKATIPTKKAKVKEELVVETSEEKEYTPNEKFTSRLATDSRIDTRASVSLGSIFKVTGNKLNSSKVTLGKQLGEVTNKLLNAVAISEGNKNDTQFDLGRAFLFDAKGNLIENTAVAMHAASMEFLANNGQELALPKDYVSLQDMTSTLPEAYKEEAEALLRNGGTYLKFAAEEIGASTIKQLGIRAVVPGTDIIDESLEARLKASFGGMALAYLAQEGYIKPITPEETGIVTDKGVIQFVVGNRKKIFGNKQIKNDVNRVKELFEADISEERNYVTEKPEARKKVNIHRMPYMEATNIQTKGINGQEAMSYSLNDGIDILNEMFVDFEEMKATLGKKELKEDEVTLDEYDSQEGKNYAVDVSVDSLQEFIDNTEKGQSVWFKWFLTKGGRFNLDSTKINPQTDKLHRFLFTTENAKSTVKIEDIEANKAEGLAFKYAIVQAFDGAIDVVIDKNSESKIIAEADRLLKLKDKELLELAKESEHIGHAANAIANIRRFRGAKLQDSFESDLTLEFDGLTNGFAFKVMQFPLGNFEEYLRKVGVIAEGDPLFKHASMNSVKDSGVSDTYEFLGENIDYSTESLEADERKIFNWLKSKGLLADLSKKDGKVSSDVRKLMKNPVMVFSYSAGIKTIEKAITADAVDKIASELYQMARKKDGVKELLAVFDKETVNQIRSLGSNSINSRNAWKVRKSLGAILGTTLAEPVGKAINDELGDYVALNEEVNNAFALAFEALSRAYIDEVIKVNNESGRKDTFRVLNMDERKKFIKKNLHLIPGIRTADSRTDSQKLLVIGRAIEDLNDVIEKASKKATLNLTAGAKSTWATVKGNVNNKNFNNINNEHKVNVAAIIRGFGAPGNAGSVIPIHVSDGLVQGMTMLAMKGYLGVHDAQVVGLGQTEAAKEYNKQWYTLNKDYSIMDSIVDMLEGISKTEGYEELTTSRGRDPIAIGETLKALKAFQKTVKANRDSIFSKHLKVGQMVGLEGSMYEANVKGSSGKIQTEIATKPEVTKEIVATKEERNPAIVTTMLEGMKDCK